MSSQRTRGALCRRCHVLVGGALWTVALLFPAVVRAAKKASPAARATKPEKAGRAAAEDPGAGFLGKWDLTVTPEQGKPLAFWLEVTREGAGFKAAMVGHEGAVAPVPEVALERDELVWKTRSTGAAPVETIYRAIRNKKGKTLEGTMIVGTDKPIPLTATRPPVWRTPKGAAAERRLGRPIVLFNGSDVAGWLPDNKGQPLGWVVKNGVLENQGKASNIYSDRKFTDFKIEVEFNVAPRSNSGVYLRGRYEIQIIDDAGKPPGPLGSGALYGFLTPSANASKPGGQWQTLVATLLGNRVTVILNGSTVIEDQEIPGITGGALDSEEGKPGPIMLQGDHGPVQYRKVVVTPFH